jgi:hypothetical protein
LEKGAILKEVTHHQSPRCEARTKAGGQCRNSALAGRSFCYIKSHGGSELSFAQRFANRFQNHWLVISIVFLFTVAGLYIGIHQLILYYRDKSREPSTGQLSGKVVNEQQQFVINVGSNTFKLGGEILRTGLDIGTLMRFRNHIPIKLYNENNRLMFDVAVHDEDGKLICSIVRNEWRFNPDGNYDRNYDINAFEIIDSDGIPLLQIQFKEVNQVYFGGYVPKKGQYDIYTPNGTIYAIDKETAKAEVRRIFMYPSSDNLGKYNLEKNPQ